MKEVILKHVQVVVDAQTLLDTDVCAIIYEFPTRRFGSAPYVEIKFVQTSNSYHPASRPDDDEHDRLAGLVVKVMSKVKNEPVPESIPNDTEYPIWLRTILDHKKISKKDKVQALNDYNTMLSDSSHPAHCGKVELSLPGLVSAFCWKESPSGHDFWSRLKSEMSK